MALFFKSIFIYVYIYLSIYVSIYLYIYVYLHIHTHNIHIYFSQFSGMNIYCSYTTQPGFPGSSAG